MGRRAQISRDVILEASLAIADADGLAAVTMQAVALALAVTPMALYRHLDGKADLLDGLVESLLTQVELPASELPWEERLRALARSTRALAQRHPNVFPLLLTRPAVTPASLRVREAVLVALADAGFGDEQARRSERLLSTAILGFAASEATGRFREHSRATLDADFACLERSIAELIGRPDLSA
jgi:AcrR family transcriptional regulator